MILDIKGSLRIQCSRVSSEEDERLAKGDILRHIMDELGTELIYSVVEKFCVTSKESSYRDILNTYSVDVLVANRADVNVALQDAYAQGLHDLARTRWTP